MKISQYILLFYSVLGINHPVFAQEKNGQIPDSLIHLSNKELYYAFVESYSDTTKATTYMNAFLYRAIKEDSLINQARAYNYLSYYAITEKKKLELLDKSISISQNLNNRTYPILPYTFKGYYYFKKGDYKLALDNYLKALELSEKVNNTEYIDISKHNIGIIKTEIGKHEEALLLFKESYAYEKTKYKLDTMGYLESLRLLGESYRYNQQIDSATYYNQKGIDLSKKAKPYYYNKFLINEGINLYYKKEYQDALDSINKGLSLINLYNPENVRSIILGKFYSGKLKIISNNNSDAYRDFVALDSIITHKKVYVAEVREGYEFILKHYKRNNDKDKQLEYINKLLSFDSVINYQRSSLTEKLFSEFDKPRLLSEKQTLISSLEKDRKNISTWLWIFISISILITMLLFWQYNKRKSLKQKFDQLITDKNKNAAVPKKKSQPTSPKEEIDVPQDIVQNVLQELQKFEEKELFLKKDITTNTLSKSVGTNPKYLSKVVNFYKKKSITNYVNDLRIEHVVNLLKENKKIRNYTIQGIAEEVGFNTAESFSSAFKKKTDIKPSYYVKELNRLEKN
ncbi:tetratricopeptide repeat protein [Aquimarina sp. D1M17]|uniref:tetratricopeptide repeat protein n=1 Tax=Aquimarina acroporae TaxID=2937283 RepID=UPI0020BE08AC|nr:tetratricopeptide repeat protein [Aquimarina acroporae]MCK8523050.1 tetratricopeptide repeat protein [Aquimarina acroporae]